MPPEWSDPSSILLDEDQEIEAPLAPEAPRSADDLADLIDEDYTPADPAGRAEYLALPTDDALVAAMAVVAPRRRDFAGLRILEVGCRTPRLMVALAVRHPEVEYLRIDTDEAALEAAEDVAIDHDLPNTRFVRHELLGVAALGEEFDLIVAGGATDRQADPAEALAVLRGVLRPEGAIFATLPGRHGRLGVEMVQGLLKMVSRGRSESERAELARGLATSMPVPHPFDPKQWEDLVPAAGNGSAGGNGHGALAGVTQLLLGPVARSYSAGDVFDLCEAAGLVHVAWLHEFLHQPWRYVVDPELVARFHGLGRREAATAAELLNSRLRLQQFFAIRDDHVIDRPTADDEDWLDIVPVPNPAWQWQSAHYVQRDGQRAVSLPSVMDNITTTGHFPPWQMAVAKLCQGGRTLREAAEHPKLRQVFSSVSDERRYQAIRDFVRQAVVEDLLYLTRPA
jgi:SAM-dependent methyltransferase